MQFIAKVIIKNASNANERQDFWEKAELNLLMDFKRVLNVCRGSAIFCQIIVQSIPQLQDRYPNTEWEELIGCTDIQICLGCNDVDTATYISKKCGMVTIKVENNQMPLMPLFSPVYTSTRPYSQTKSNTQRPLMFPDEVLRMDNKACLVLLQGEKPLYLYKIILDKHPSFQRLRDVRVADHVPLWRQEMPETRNVQTPLVDASAPAKVSPARLCGPDTSETPPTPEVVQPVEEAETPFRPLSARVPEWDYGLLDPNLSSLTGEVPAQDAAYGPLAPMETSPQQVGGERNEEGRR
jgi:type IV secretion system protein VirD4